MNELQTESANKEKEMQMLQELATGLFITFIVAVLLTVKFAPIFVAFSLFKRALEERLLTAKGMVWLSGAALCVAIYVS